MTIPLPDLVLLWRLIRSIAMRQPRALWPFLKLLHDSVRNNPRAVDCVGMLAGLYLHLEPFSRFVIAMVDQEIARCDSGEWQSPLAATKRQAAPIPLHEAFVA